MNRIIAVIALLISITALAVAAMSYVHAERIAEIKVKQHEKEVVDVIFPWFDAMFVDFGPDRYPYKTKPETIAELVDPMFNQKPIIEK